VRSRPPPLTPADGHAGVFGFATVQSVRHALADNDIFDTLEDHHLGYGSDSGSGW